MAHLNYLLLYYVIHYRRKVVRTNLCNSFRRKACGEIKAIERKYYKHLADLSIELYKLWHMSEGSIRKRCVFKNTELPQSYFDEGKSVIGVLGHYGGVDVFIQFVGNGGGALALYKPIRDKVTDRMMKRIRSRSGRYSWQRMTR
ncbi:MAG: hypothetical protein V8R91_16680 [Butyricimonas faecihominis]